MDSQALAGRTVPTANSLVFEDDTSIVTLADLHWADSSVYNLDRVGYIHYQTSVALPDGKPDRVAQLTLNVAPIPKPETWTLAGIAVLLLDIWPSPSPSGRMQHS